MTECLFSLALDAASLYIAQLMKIPALAILLLSTSLAALPLPQIHPDPMQAVQSTVKAIHDLRAILDKPEAIFDHSISHLKYRFSSMTTSAKRDFLFFCFGPGLMYLDGFQEDLSRVFELLEDPRTRDAASARLQEVGFDKFALSLIDLSTAPLEDGSVSPIQQGARNVEGMGSATAEVLSTQDEFIRAAGAAEKWLWRVHTTAVVTLSSFALYKYQHSLGLDAMTPRELATSLGGVWGFNHGLYWLIFDGLEWMDTYRELVAKPQYLKMVDAWGQVLHFYPPLTAPTAGAAAAPKPINQQTRMDIIGKAAFDALLRNKSDPNVREQIFELFLSALENGHPRLAMKCLKALQSGGSGPEHDRLMALTSAIQNVFKARTRMENRSYLSQLEGAVATLALVGIAFWAMREGIDTYLPPHLAQWKTVPNAVLGWIGGKRLFQLFWRPHRPETLQKYTVKDEAALKEALKRLMDLDPSGEIVTRIAQFDSGKAAHQLMTRAAAEVLAERASGKTTLELARIVREELSRYNLAGQRVAVLAEAALTSHRSCHQRLVQTFQKLDRALNSR